MKIRKTVELCSISALQIYFAVKTLDEVLESKSDKPLKDIKIVNNLVLRQNVDLLHTQNFPEFIHD